MKDTFTRSKKCSVQLSVINALNNRYPLQNRVCVTWEAERFFFPGCSMKKFLRSKGPYGKFHGGLNDVRRAGSARVSSIRR